MKTRAFWWVGLLLVGLALPPAPLRAAAATQTGEEEGKIEGITIARPSGGYLGFEVVNDNFKLSFYDGKKKPVPVDVARASARWKGQQKSGQEFTVLNPAGDGQSLVSVKFVRGPYTFIVYLTLLNEAGEAVESYPINLQAY
jgi:hypothetical protein